MNRYGASPEDSSLGRSVQYCEQYAPELLFPIPRQSKRDEIGVAANKLPFQGQDIWNAFELSWLNLRGKPQVAMATFRIPAESPNLIESKSFKLYLNSYNQTRLDGEDELLARLTRDISQAAGAPVSVELTLPKDFAAARMGDLPGESLDALDIEIDHYHPSPDYLVTTSERVSESLHSNLLKSNCLVTGQPDWASILIRYVGRKLDREGLLRYLVGFRQHNEFHEQCVERIFVDIWKACQPSELTVYARYTRRGGLDINPFRTSGKGLVPENIRTARQ